MHDVYKKMRSTRIKQLKEWRVIPHWIWVVIVIVGCVLVLKDSSSWWLKMIGLIFVSYSSLQLGSQIWKVDDFMDGYEKGLTHEINKNSDSTNQE